MAHADFAPTQRRLLHVFSASFVAALMWAIWADLDIVVSAQGKLTPTSFVRVAQPLEGGVVKRLMVKDGDTVSKGQALVELDPLYAQADASTSEQQEERLRLQLERIEAELTDKPFEPTQGTEGLKRSVQTDFMLRRQALASAVLEAQAAVAKAQADLRGAEERVARATQLVPLVSKQHQMQQELLKEGFVSVTTATDKQKELVDAKQDLLTQQAAVTSAKSAVLQAQAALTRVKDDYRKQLTAERAQALAELQATEGAAAKNKHRLQQTTLQAPAAGTVNGLGALSVGQVVSNGVVLLNVVPHDEPLRMEAWLRNEDAAFVAPGMPAKVKLSSYPFQKYGWVEGQVSWLGVDAETPESMKNAQGEPLFYRVRITLNKQAVSRDGRSYALMPGMQGVADIRVGSRTLLEYLTNPLKKIALEAAREK